MTDLTDPRTTRQALYAPRPLPELSEDDIAFIDANRDRDQAALGRDSRDFGVTVPGEGGVLIISSNDDGLNFRLVTHQGQTCALTMPRDRAEYHILHTLASDQPFAYTTFAKQFHLTPDGLCTLESNVCTVDLAPSLTCTHDTHYEHLTLQQPLSLPHLIAALRILPYL